jgi:hypothetical protein
MLKAHKRGTSSRWDLPRFESLRRAVEDYDVIGRVCKRGNNAFGLTIKCTVDTNNTAEEPRLQGSGIVSERLSKPRVSCPSIFKP